MVWKFDAAPADLRVLGGAAGSPRWLALVPAAMHGPDLELAILTQVGSAGLERCQTAAGDVVYIGSSDVTELLEIVGSHTSADPPQRARQ